MRPITSGIGSAPHRLAKHLAKPLTQCLGVMSPTHLRNSADLLQKLKNVDHRGKKMVSFDVVAIHQRICLWSHESIKEGAGFGRCGASSPKRRLH